MPSASDGPVSNSRDRISEDVNYLTDATHLTCPGSIQPHGYLLILSPDTLNILAASENVSELFSLTLEQLWSADLPQLLPDSAQEWLVTTMATGEANRRIDAIAGQPFYLNLSPHPAGWLCEIEPASETSVPSLTVVDNLQTVLHRLLETDETQSLLDYAAQKLSELTGFDRVLVYRFDEQQNGEVVAEQTVRNARRYLGLHFPASDIPAVVRDLYREGPLRYVPDLTAGKVKIVAPSDVDVESLDLSQSILRSVDDCCVAYHQHMGVWAFIVIPLIVNRQLWGLITLHHPEKIYLSIPKREAIFLVGQVLSLSLTNCINAEKLAYETQLKRLQGELIEAFSNSDKFEEVLIQPNLQLLDLVNAQGAALCLNNGITLIGETPDAEQVFELLRWAQSQVRDFIYSTHQLPRAFPPAAVYQKKAAGVLLLRISDSQNFSILWFRSEKLRQVDWAGDPREPFALSDEGQMSPRRSFERWRELIQWTSLPWLESEIENALGLRAAISGIALRRVDELARINQELEKTNEELASFAYAASHDLKEPLRGIYNYTTFLIEDYREDLDEAGVERMQALLRLTRRMDQLIDALLKFSQMRQLECTFKPIQLQRLLDNAVEMMQMSRIETTFDMIYPRPLPEISGDSILLNELFSNLISNALKYNDSDVIKIEIGFITPEEYEQLPASTPKRLNLQSRNLFYVKDNGIGIRPRHLRSIFRLFKRLHGRDRYGGGTGAGLTIVKKIVERHGGEIWVDSVYGEGTTFWFALT